LYASATVAKGVLDTLFIDVPHLLSLVSAGLHRLDFIGIKLKNIWALIHAENADFSASHFYFC